MKKTIREIKPEESLETSTRIIRTAFSTVAEDFGLTQENCPSHPSFMTIERLQEARDKGVVFFGYFIDAGQAGFVAVENAGDGLYYMERLAVIPEYRHQKIGLSLVNHVFQYIRNNHGNRLSIGIIDEQTVLKNWYQAIGFKSTGTRKFEHLPFTVGFMEIDL